MRDFSTTVLMGCGPFVKDIGSVPRQHQVAFGPFDLDPGLSKDNLGQCQSTTTTRIIMMIVSLFLLFFCGCCFGRRCSCLVRNGLRQVFACFGNFVEPCLIGHWTLRRDNAAIAKGHANHGWFFFFFFVIVVRSVVGIMMIVRNGTKGFQLIQRNHMTAS